MEPLSKMEHLKLEETRRMKSYIKQKSLGNNRLEFKWQTHRIDTRVNMKDKYPPQKKNTKKKKYECPHLPPAGLQGLPGPEGGAGPGAVGGGQGNLPQESHRQEDGSGE